MGGELQSITGLYRIKEGSAAVTLTAVFHYVCRPVYQHQIVGLTVCLSVHPSLSIVISIYRFCLSLFLSILSIYLLFFLSIYCYLSLFI